jgi:glycosyltransferase involved in cell wall biosynthesis
MIKVSIVVPVYNVEEYLVKCLTSLVNQTLKDIEIIVVNDGATDRSEIIIQEFALKYSNIIALMKENGGLSDARNYGVQHAKGEYIGFIDSDDFVDLEMYEALYRKAKESDYDIVECNLHHTYENSEDTEIGKEIYDKNDLIMNGRSVVWNKIYKREWLFNTGVVFPKSLIYEDVEFFIKLVPFIEKYAYVKPAYVHYLQRNSSINNISSKKTLDIIRILINIKDFYEENGFWNTYHDSLEYLFTRILLCSSFGRMCKIPVRKDREEALARNFELLNEVFPDWRKKHIFRGKYDYKRNLYENRYKLHLFAIL